jgi:hypothetical protein
MLWLFSIQLCMQVKCTMCAFMCDGVCYVSMFSMLAFYVGWLYLHGYLDGHQPKIGRVWGG